MPWLRKLGIGNFDPRVERVVALVRPGRTPGYHGLRSKP
jgi:hypothetical protein